MTSPENQHRRGYGGEDPRRASDAPVKDEVDMGRRYIEVSDESGAGDSIALRGYGGEDGSRASDEPIREDVEGVATRAVAGPLRVEEGDYAVGIDDYADGVGRRYVEDTDAQRGYGGEDARRASDEPIRDDVEGVATRAVAGPLRVEEGEPTHEVKEIDDGDEATVDELADAMDSGEVSPDQAAETIAGLMEQNDALKRQIEGLETQVADLNARLKDLLDKLDQMTEGTKPGDEDGESTLTDEEVVATGNSILEKLADESTPSSPDTLTADEQAALQKRMEEEGDAEHDNGTENDQTTPEQYFNEQLVSTRDKYAELTAKDRLSYLGRLMKSDGLLSRAVRRIPGVSGMLDNLNSSSSKSKAIEEARANYEIALREMEDFVTGTAEVEGKTIEEIQRAGIRLQIQEEHQLTLEIHDHQMSTGKDRNKFTDWWVRNNGIGGKILKAGVVVGASLVTGGAAGAIAAGVFGAAAAAGLAGAGIGALTGGGIAKHVTDRRARSFIDKEGKQTAAGREMLQDRADMDAERASGSEPLRGVEVDALPANEVKEPRRAIGPDWAQRMTGVVEARTDEIVKNNRGRMKAAIGLGAAAGGLAGGFVGNAVDNAMHSGVRHNVIDNPSPNEGTNPDQRYDQMLKGHEFKVEPGNSVIEEIKQAAHMNGHDISMHRAEEIYNHIYENVGDKIIHGGPEYHGPSGDIRFGESGMYGWGKGVLQQIVNLSGK